MTYNKFRDSSNRLTINFNNIPSFLYWWYKKKIIKKFNLKQTTALTESIDFNFQTFKSNRGSINIEWDTWSGLSIVAIDSKSEILLLDILRYLK